MSSASSSFIPGTHLLVLGSFSISCSIAAPYFVASRRESDFVDARVDHLERGKHLLEANRCRLSCVMSLEDEREREK